MNSIYNLSLEQIKYKNIYKLIEEYNYNLNLLKKNRLCKRIISNNYGLSIIELEELLEIEEMKHNSQYYFPGDTVLLYSRNYEQKTKKNITCNFSGAIIRPGSFYINYRPLIDNISTGEVYVLKNTLKVDKSYSYILPTTIQELENLTYNLLSDSEEYETIDFSHLRQVVGEDFSFQKLKRR